MTANQVSSMIRPIVDGPFGPYSPNAPAQAWHKPAVTLSTLGEIWIKPLPIGFLVGSAGGAELGAFTHVDEALAFVRTALERSNEA